MTESFAKAIAVADHMALIAPETVEWPKRRYVPLWAWYKKRKKRKVRIK